MSPQLSSDKLKPIGAAVGTGLVGAVLAVVIALNSGSQDSSEPPDDRTPATETATPEPEDSQDSSEPDEGQEDSFVPRDEPQYEVPPDAAEPQPQHPRREDRRQRETDPLPE